MNLTRTIIYILMYVTFFVSYCFFADDDTSDRRKVTFIADILLTIAYVILSVIAKDAYAIVWTVLFLVITAGTILIVFYDLPIIIFLIGLIIIALSCANAAYVDDRLNDVATEGSALGDECFSDLRNAGVQQQDN